MMKTTAMYNPQEASQVRQQFWTTLGQYLTPIPSATGLKVNWINYKTGVKAIRFKMDVLPKHAFAGVEINGTAETRSDLYRMFLLLKQDFPHSYTWLEATDNADGKSVSRIYKSLHGFTPLNKAHWPELIAFLKEQIIAFDGFWALHNEVFKMNA